MVRWGAPLSILLLAMLAAGCGDDVGPPPDGGQADADGGTAPPDGSTAGPQIPWLAEGAPPIEPPAPPVLTPCPAGWRMIMVGETPACDPYPEGGPIDCPDGEAHFPGEPGCAPVGAACPAGDFPDDLPASGVLYVLAGAAAGGDGTRARPYARIGDASAAATAGTTIAIGRGVYDEGVSPRAGVTLRGACAAATVITSPVADARPGVVVVRGSGIVLRDLTIADTDRSALWIEGAGIEVELSGVMVARATTAAVIVAGAVLTARGLVVRDTRGPAGFGRGLRIESGATATIERAALERNREIALIVRDAGTTATFTDVVVRDTQSDAVDLAFGRGLFVQAPARAEVVRGAFLRNRELAVSAEGAGASLRLTDVVVRDTASEEITRHFGSGIGVLDGASLEASRLVVARSFVAGLFVQAGATLRLEDVVVDGVRSRDADGVSGVGVQAVGGASLTASRLRIVRASLVGLAIGEEGTTATIEDLAVRETLGQERDARFGRGIVVQEGATATIDRASVEESRATGVLVAVGAEATFTDLSVTDTHPQEADGTEGQALGVQEATATVTRGVLARSHIAGLAVIAGRGTLVDVAVQDVEPAGTGLTGHGITGQLGATIELDRVLVERSHEVGLVVQTAGTTVRAADLVIRDVQPAFGDFGRGIDVEDGASASIERALVERCREFGVVVLAAGSSLTLRDAIVRDTASRNGQAGLGMIGAFGVELVLERTRFERNRMVGVLVLGAGSRLTATDLDVADTASQETDGYYGRALSVERGATATVTGGAFERSRETAIFVHGAGSSAMLTGVSVRDTLARACAETTCRDQPFGIGAASFDGGALTLRDFVITRSELCGLQLASGGAADLTRGEVSENPIGACLQSAGFDVGRITAEVRYRDNGTNIETTDFPVAGESDPIPIDP